MIEVPARLTFIQEALLVPRSCAKRDAVLGVMPRRPFTITTFA